MKEAESIVFLDLAKAFGGGETFLVALVGALAKSGWIVKTITDDSSKVLSSVLASAHLPQASAKTKALPMYFKDPLLFWRALMEILSLAGQVRPIAFFTNNYRAHIFGLFAALTQPNVSCCCILHDFMFPRWLPYLLRWCSRIVFAPVSETTCLYYRCNPKNILPNGFDFDSVIAKDSKQAMALQYNLDAGRKWIIGCGGYAKWKGVETFIEAASLFGKSRGDVEFIWVGNIPAAGSAVYRRVKSRIEALQNSNVRLLPTTSEFHSLLGNCDVFVSASLSRHGGPESFGRAIVEAMALKVPVVSTNVGEPARYIRHAVNGMLVKCKRPREIAREIDFLLNDTLSRNRIVENAYITSQQYDIRRTRDRFVGIARQLGFDARFPSSEYCS